MGSPRKRSFNKMETGMIGTKSVSNKELDSEFNVIIDMGNRGELLISSDRDL